MRSNNPESDMPLFPPQMGVCLFVSIASDSSTTATGSMNTIEEKETYSFPNVLCIGNLRHVAPYFILKELAVGKLAKGKTIEQALCRTNLPGGGGGSSIVKNVALIDWWPKELIAGRLILSKIGKQQKEQGIIATPDHLIQDGEVLRGRYHFHEQSILDDPRPTIVYDDENYIVVNNDVLSNPDAHRVVNSLPGIVLGLFDHDTDQSSLSAGIIIPAHRIDNPVSGLVCCGKTNKDAKRLSRKIQSRETIKTYLARVKISARAIDKINNLPFDIEIPLGFDSSRGCAFADFSKSGKPSRTSILAVLVPPLIMTEPA
eukprot:CAMPEP_0116080028 /NCGR_PEP_ID=MMETSP0327-20121206/1458_1 /TAXON_ID=44447 /ORGANISM="Pseudo-nitzschia delicatissima, Strain B596" /LENGTH=315 /DNA_ID=CAMNT_0003570695 /DNA_START=284 /DNA_END=1232 /DNA_ORIENTATION=-